MTASRAPRQGPWNAVCAAATVVVLCLGCSPNPNGSQPVALSITLARLSSNECIVAMELTNKGAEDLELDENDFPWRIAGDALTVALVEEDGLLKNPLHRTPMILDPVVALPTILKRGETRSKEVDLAQYFHE